MRWYVGWFIGAVGLVACDDATSPRDVPPRDGISDPSASAVRPSRSIRQGPNILLVTLDTTRADYLGSGGREIAQTPRLDAFAAEGARFTQAQTVCPLTAPAHASMLTGLYPFRHGVRDNGRTAIPVEAETLAEALSACGYATCASVGSVVLESRFGFGRGFDTFASPQRTTGDQRSFASSPAEEVNEAAMSWLAERDDERPWFLWVHYYDPHAPYTPPRGFAVEGGTPYDGELRYTDHAVGALLDAVAPWHEAESLVSVIVADHGEAFGFKGEPTHSYFVYDPQACVPLFLRLPGGDEAHALAVESVVSVADIAPTVFDLLDLQPVVPFDGVSLVDVEACRAREAVYLESCYPYLHHQWSPIAGIVTQREKYLHSTQPEYFDRTQSALESDDLAADRPSDVARCRGVLAALLAAHPPLATSEAEMDPALRSQLEAMGYLVDGSQVAIPDLLDLDPAWKGPDAMRPLISRFFRATTPGPPIGLRIRELQALVRDDPGNVSALDHLAQLHLSMRRYGDAGAVLDRLLALRPEHAVGLANLGAVQQSSGDLEGALETYGKALIQDPESPTVLQNMIVILDHLEREDEAATYRTRLRALDGE